MKKIISLKLYNDNILNKEYKDINAIFINDRYSMILEDVKTSLDRDFFIRESEEYKFVLNIKEKKALYTLKMTNTIFDIEVEKIIYKKEKNTIKLEYKISSEEGTLKIVIEEKGDINE
ncbi:MAG: hypothetical protein ACI4WW_03850 [Candidatus Coprovivens sp.]